MKITTDNILDALHKEPTLGYGGFYATAAEARHHRGELITGVDEVQLCVDWLVAQDIGEKVTSRSHSSYGLKHAVEYATGLRAYVSNGCFLVACVILGVPYKRFGASKNPNAMVAVKRHRRNRKLHTHLMYDSCWADYKPLPGVDYATTLIVCEGETNAKSLRQVVTNQNVHVISLGSEFATTPQKLAEYAKSYTPLLVWANSPERTEELMALLPGVRAIKSPGGQDATALLQSGKLCSYLAFHRFHAAQSREGKEGILSELVGTQRAAPGANYATDLMADYLASLLGVSL